MSTKQPDYRPFGNTWGHYPAYDEHHTRVPQDPPVLELGERAELSVGQRLEDGFAFSGGSEWLTRSP